MFYHHSNLTLVWTSFGLNTQLQDLSTNRIVFIQLINKCPFQISVMDFQSLWKTDCLTPWTTWFSVGQVQVIRLLRHYKCLHCIISLHVHCFSCVLFRICKSSSIENSKHRLTDPTSKYFHILTMPCHWN